MKQLRTILALVFLCLPLSALASQVPIVVTTTVDEDDGSAAPGFGAGTSLREAIKYSAIDQEITVPDNIPNGLYNLTLGQITIDHDLTLNGAGAATTRVNALNNSRVFLVQGQGFGVTINDITIEGGNIPADSGGGIMAFMGVTCNRCVFSNNHANFGGGIQSSIGDLVLTECTISSNSATFSGGGVRTTTFDFVVFIRCTFNDNSAPNGAAVDNFAGCDIINSTVSGNTASGGGGAVRDNPPASIRLTCCTVTNNTGGGVYNNFGMITLRNTIVAGNAGPVLDLVGFNNTYFSDGYNYVGNSVGEFTIENSNHDIVSINSPLLGPLASNGGSTQTHMPLSGSPVIDQGGFEEDEEDQRGLPRAVDLSPPNAIDGNANDIGAVEVQSESQGPAATSTAMQAFNAIYGAITTGYIATITSTPNCNEGTVTFVMRDAMSTVIQTDNGTVNNGVCSITIGLPPLLPAGTYSVDATYNGTQNFTTSSGVGSFSILPRNTTTTPNAATATVGDPSVALSAAVIGGLSVNEGSVTFTVSDGQIVIGIATTSGTVAGGSASVSYAIPPGTPAGSYTITASYNPDGNFSASLGTSTLNILPQSTTPDCAGLETLLDTIFLGDAWNYTVVLSTGTVASVLAVDSFTLEAYNISFDAMTQTFTSTGVRIAGLVDIQLYNADGKVVGDMMLTIRHGNGNKNSPQIISRATASPNPVMVSTAVNCTVVATDADGDGLSYYWDFGDGCYSRRANTTHVYAVPGRYEVTLVCSDGVGVHNIYQKNYVVVVPHSENTFVADKRTKIDINLRKEAASQLILAGRMSVPAGIGDGVSVSATIAETAYAEVFTLNSKGAGGTAFSRLEIKTKIVGSANSNAAFYLHLKSNPNAPAGQTLREICEPLGSSGRTIGSPGEPEDVTLVLSIAGGPPQPMTFKMIHTCKKGAYSKFKLAKEQ